MRRGSQSWNGAHDGHSPALVVRCTGAGDVLAAVGFARDSDRTIAVRAGGHSLAGFSTVDDGIVIDLLPMREVGVDLAARRATVGRGAVWADVDHETQAHGLGTCTTPTPTPHKEWGAYVNVNLLGDSDAATAAYGEETYARLVSLNGAHDQTNMFHPNHNIEPSTPAA